MQRRLAAIVAVDVVGYSSLMGADEEGTLTRLKAIRREVVDPNVEAHEGRVVKSSGDGLLLEFASAVAAVQCSMAIQTALAEQNRTEAPERAIVFRIGINVGDVIVEPDRDVYGDGVNIAARLEALAEPGSICISRTVRDQVRDKLPYGFEDLGALPGLLSRDSRQLLGGDRGAATGHASKPGLPWLVSPHPRKCLQVDGPAGHH